MKKLLLAVAAVAAFGALGESVNVSTVAEGAVKISCDYPGGNVKVVDVKPTVVTVDSDLRDTPRDWFYWNFEAESDAAGTVRFTFPKDSWRLSAQGPAVSRDGGRSWQWLGKAKSHFKAKDDPHDYFDFTFAKAGEKVRFSQNIPYLKDDLDRFLGTKKGNPELKIGTLAKTRKGTPVPLLTIGHGPKNVLMTARHHACEASASYVLEGILDEILSGSAFGRTFCERYMLSCVPLVDIDGVQAGDQGKGRAPHDHNRDYAVVSNLYPEVKAIIDLDEAKKFALALDFHSPALRGDVHEAVYLTGVKTPKLMANSNELIDWALEECPDLRILNHAFKASPDSFKDGKPFSVYFGFRPHVVYGTTLEVAYANGNNPRYDADFGRQLGRAFLRGLVRTDFSESEAPRTAHARFVKVGRSIPARTDQIYQAAEAVLKDPATTPAERVSVQLRVALSHSRYKEYAAALKGCDAALAEPWATARQRGEAFVLKASVLCRDEKATEADRAAHVKAFEAAARNLSSSARHDFAEIQAAACLKRGDRTGARSWAERQLADASGVQVFRARNRLTKIDLEDGKKAAAVESARETVRLAKAALDPVPIGVQGPQIVLEYVRALKMLPETTPEALKAAADLGLKHPNCQKHIRTEIENQVN